MTLIEPRKKWKAQQPPQPPFPVPISSLSDGSAGSKTWRWFHGKFNGDVVVIEDRKEMETIYNMGYFGKGNLSHSGPQFDKSMQSVVQQQPSDQDVPPFISRRQWKRRQKWANASSSESVNKKAAVIARKNKNFDQSEMPTKQANNASTRGTACVLSENRYTSGACSEVSDVENEAQGRETLTVEGEENKTQDISLPPTPSSHDRVMVFTDSDSDDENYIFNLEPVLKENPYMLKEVLHLSLEESFFLSFGLGCLIVSDEEGDNLTLREMWTEFCSSQDDFVQKYIAYHYFRSKGWVVKPGLKFGVDFLLYKQGPSFYHASYSVLVEVLDGETWERDQKMTSRNLTWTDLSGINRVNTAAAKEVLLAQVVKPASISDEELKSPKCIGCFTVREILIKRWVASQEREEREKEDDL